MLTVRCVSESYSNYIKSVTSSSNTEISELALQQLKGLRWLLSGPNDADAEVAETASETYREQRGSYSGKPFKKSPQTVADGLDLFTTRLQIDSVPVGDLISPIGTQGLGNVNFLRIIKTAIRHGPRKLGDEFLKGSTNANSGPKKSNPKSKTRGSSKKSAKKKNDPAGDHDNDSDGPDDEALNLDEEAGPGTPKAKAHSRKTKSGPDKSNKFDEDGWCTWTNLIGCCVVGILLLALRGLYHYWWKSEGKDGGFDAEDTSSSSSSDSSRRSSVDGADSGGSGRDI